MLMTALAIAMFVLAGSGNAEWKTWPCKGARVHGTPDRYDTDRPIFLEVLRTFRIEAWR
jgi:hypothetical protein